MKETTIQRFKLWSVDKSDDAVFISGTDSWTKSEFEAAFLGGKPKKAAKTINTDVKVKENADLDRTLETGHTEESGE